MIICDRCRVNVENARHPLAYGRGKTADLCKECYNELLEFLHDPDAEENENESEESH